MARHLLSLLVAVVAIVLTATVAAQDPTSAPSAAPAPAPEAPAPAPEAGDKNSTTTPTAYEMLKRYDFPPGILPEGAQSYEINADGSFQVNFPDECHFRVSKYKVRYSSRVAGNIQNGTISGLEGVKVKIVFAWIHIGEVRHNGDELRLKAGSISKSFPVGDFSVSPQCN